MKFRRIAAVFSTDLNVVIAFSDSFLGFLGAKLMKLWKEKEWSYIPRTLYVETRG